MTEPAAASPRDPHRPALVVAAALIGDALQLSNGFYGIAPLTLVGVALTLAWLAVIAPRALGRLLPDRRIPLLVVLVAVVVMQLLLISTVPIGLYFRRPMPWQHTGFVPGLIVAGLAVIAATVAGRRGRLVAAAAVLAAVTWLGVLTYRGSPNPLIDVVPVHHDAFAALGRGESPYSMSFTDIYAGREQFYPPGMTADGRVLYGFPYPPLSLAMAWPGHLAGDFRYAELAALVAAAALMIAAGRGSSIAIAAAAVLLFTPRGFFALEQAWTEPFAILWVAAAIWAATSRRPLLAAAFLGLAIATKQYLALAVPVAWLLGDDRASRQRAVATILGVAALALLPALADLPGFVHSAVMVQVREVLRMDALSFAVPWSQIAGTAMPGAVYAVLVIVAAVVAVWRAPATPAGIAAALAVTLFTAFAFGKKAFCNYYVMVLAVLVLAIAARRKDAEVS